MSQNPHIRQDRLEVYRDGELIHEQNIFIPVTPEAPVIVALRERLAELEAQIELVPEPVDTAAIEARLATVAEAADAALDPAATPARKQTLRNQIRDIIKGALPAATDGKETP